MSTFYRQRFNWIKEVNIELIPFIAFSKCVPFSMRNKYLNTRYDNFWQPGFTTALPMAKIFFQRLVVTVEALLKMFP